MNSQRLSLLGLRHTLFVWYLLFSLLSLGSLSAGQSTCSNYGMTFSGNNGFFTDTSSQPLWYALQEFTLEFWIKFDDLASLPQGVVQAFVVTGVTSCDIEGFGFYRYNKTLSFIMGGTGVCDTNSLDYDMAVGVWTHVAVVVGGATVDFYVDGELFDSKPMTGPINFNNAPFKVGLGPDPQSGFNVGDLDEIRFWNTTRSADQVKNNYRVSLSTFDNSLLAYWRFEGGQSDSVTDSSLYNRQVLISDTLQYVPDCSVASCLCNTPEYCVPGNDRTNEAIECPSTSSTSSSASSSSIPTSSSTKMTSSSASSSSSTMSSSSSKTSSSTMSSSTISSGETTKMSSTTAEETTTMIDTEAVSSSRRTVLGLIILFGFSLM